MPSSIDNTIPATSAALVSSVVRNNWVAAKSEIEALQNTAPVVLSSDTTYHVQTTGNDSTGDGSSGSPWLTVQKAINYISEKVHANGYNVTIQLGNGTYSGDIVVRNFRGVTAANAPRILCDTTTPSNGVLSATTVGVLCEAGAIIRLAGVKIQATAGGSSTGIESRKGGRVFIDGNIEFGACNSYCMYAHGSGHIYLGATANTTFSGNAAVAILLIANSSVVWDPAGTQSITYSGSPTFSGATVLNRNSKIYKVAGTATGTHTGNNLTEHGGYSNTKANISANAWVRQTNGLDH